MSGLADFPVLVLVLVAVLVLGRAPQLARSALSLTLSRGWARGSELT